MLLNFKGEKAAFITQGNTMRSILIIAVLFSASALAQDALKAGNEVEVQVKPKGPVGCKPLGTVGGTKLWAGDCAQAFARVPRRNDARELIDARPPAEEKTWWNR